MRSDMAERERTKSFLTRPGSPLSFRFLLLAGMAVCLLTACGKKQQEIQAPSSAETTRRQEEAQGVSHEEAPYLSERLFEEIKDDWRKWEAKSREAQALSSRLPGSLWQYFFTWENAVDFLGFAPWNPLEEAEWLEKMNTAGTAILQSGETRIRHAQVLFDGDRDGRLTYAAITAGYAEGSVRVILTAEMIRRGTDSQDPGKQIPLNGSVLARETRDENENYQAVNLCFDREKISYRIRLIAAKSAAGTAALEEAYQKILELIRESF